MIEIFEFIRPWPVGWQMVFLTIISAFLTHIVVTMIKYFTQDFMSIFVVLFRGWPPKHVTMANEENDEDNKVV